MVPSLSNTITNIIHSLALETNNYNINRSIIMSSIGATFQSLIAPFSPNSQEHNERESTTLTMTITPTTPMTITTTTTMTTETITARVVGVMTEGRKIQKGQERLSCWTINLQGSLRHTLQVLPVMESGHAIAFTMYSGI